VCVCVPLSLSLSLSLSFFLPSSFRSILGFVNYRWGVRELDCVSLVNDCRLKERGWGEPLMRLNTFCILLLLFESRKNGIISRMDNRDWLTKKPLYCQWRQTHKSPSPIQSFCLSLDISYYLSFQECVSPSLLRGQAAFLFSNLGLLR
jgi:hypothetical protein